jgi:hypothetical protein
MGLVRILVKAQKDPVEIVTGAEFVPEMNMSKDEEPPLKTWVGHPLVDHAGERRQPA